MLVGGANFLPLLILLGSNENLKTEYGQNLGFPGK